MMSAMVESEICEFEDENIWECGDGNASVARCSSAAYWLKAALAATVFP